MIFTDANGKQWEFTGEYRKPRPGDYALSDVGEVEEATCSWPEQRAIVHPVRKEHIFGGVVFEELPNPRPVQAGEFYLYSEAFKEGRPATWDEEEPSRCSYTILRPIRIGGVIE